MIRKNQMNFKLDIKKHSSALMLSALEESFKPELERCPSCGAKGCCRPFSSYERYIIDIVDGHLSVPDHKYEIMRVKCSSCKCTHAILPDCIVPYSVYSLPCILYILRIYFTHSMTIEEICSQFGIAYSTLRRWNAAFAAHKSWWLGFVRAGKVPALAFLDDILGRDPFSRFTMDFLCRTLYSFLQTHASPSNCCRAVPGWPDPGGGVT